MISTDTRRVDVMRAALAAGASIVNDVTALSEPGAIEVVRDAGASAILMHMQGSPSNHAGGPVLSITRLMRLLPISPNASRTANGLGLSRDRIAVDPGIGFGKSDRS